MAEYSIYPSQSEEFRTVGELQDVGAAALIDDGECPWCEDYSGEHVGQHASSAHPELWREYRDG